MNDMYIDIVFNGPPRNDHGKFIDVQDAEGNSIGTGSYVNRGDGTYALRVRLTVPNANTGGAVPSAN